MIRQSEKIKEKRQEDFKIGNRMDQDFIYKLKLKESIKMILKNNNCKTIVSKIFRSKFSGKSNKKRKKR